MEITQDLLNQVEKRLAKNKNYYIGYPHNMDFDYSALQETAQYHINNIGNPFHHGYSHMTTKERERDVLRYRGSKYHLKSDECDGYVSSSGTEGNMRGIYIAKKQYNDITLFYSADTHYSFDKIADLMSIPAVVVPSQIHGEIDYDALRGALIQFVAENARSDKPRIPVINLTIGTTVKGATDNLDTVLQILADLGITEHHIHLDCALSGGFLPFLDDASKPDIGFHKDIKTMAISGHKFVGLPTPAGIALTRKSLVQSFSDSAYIGSHDTTIMGSRNGHAPLQLRYAQESRGDSGFAAETKQCFDTTRHLVAALTSANIPHLCNPYSITVVFPKPSDPIVKKYQLACKDEMAHVVVMHHVSKEILDELVSDLVCDGGAKRKLVL